MYTGENRPLTPKESQSNAAFKQFSELVSVFKESSRNFLIIFRFHSLKNSELFAHVQKVLNKFKRPSN
jgi:hypothetical protein